MRVESISIEKIPELLDLYATVADPSPFQHPCWWEFLVDAFRVDVHVLAARKPGGSLAGYLLLYESENVLAGPHISSLEDGILVAENTAVAPLLGAARELHCRTGKRYLLVRGGASDNAAPSVTANVVRTIVPTEHGASSVWRQMSSNTRRKVRRAKKNGFEVVLKHDREAFVTFGKHFAKNQKRLGTPIFDVCVIEKMQLRLAPLVHLLQVRRHSEACGGMLVVAAPKRWCSLYVAMEEAALPLYATYQLYWSAIEMAAAEGLMAFDLGRSQPGSGTHMFKQAWAGFDEPIIYRYWYRGSPPAAPPFRHSRAASVQRRLWKLLPSPVTTRVGALIRRDLPFL